MFLQLFLLSIHTATEFEQSLGFFTEVKPLAFNTLKSLVFIKLTIWQQMDIKTATEVSLLPALFTNGTS